MAHGPAHCSNYPAAPSAFQEILDIERQLVHRALARFERGPFRSGPRRSSGPRPRSASPDRLLRLLGAVLGNVVFTIVAPRVPRFGVFAVGFLLAGAPRFARSPSWIPLVDLPRLLHRRSVDRRDQPDPRRGHLRTPSRSTTGPGARAHPRRRPGPGIPLGGLLGGAAVQGLGLPAAFLLFGSAYLVVTLMPFVLPVWRELDRRPSPAADPTPTPAPDVTAVPSR